MKKLSFFALMAILLVAFSACTEEVETSPVTVDLFQKATVNGVAMAELNLQKAGLEFVPQGTKIQVEVRYDQLNPSVTGNEMWQEWVEVGANGKFSVQLPATSMGVVANLNSFFEAEQVQSYGYYTRSIVKKYSINYSQVYVRTGQTIDTELNYFASLPTTYVPKVTVTGLVRAELDAQKIGLENVPNGTFIVFSSETWADSVAVQNGVYTIQVPKDARVKRKIVFRADQKIWVPNANPVLSEYLTIPGRVYNSQFVNLIYTDNTEAPAFEVTASVMAGNPTAVMLTGSVLADLDGTIAGFESVPDGTKIYFYNDSWGATATVANGKYEVEIPFSRQLQYFMEFSANKRIISNGLVSFVLHKYQVAGGYLAYIPPFVNTINAGNGSPE